MCVFNAAPTVDYGQGNRAWNPEKRDPVYQQIERARSDPGFARNFAADILFGKKETGGAYYTYETRRETSEDAKGRLQTSTTQELVKNKSNRKGDYLYNENTLNASKSWVAQSFGAPAVKGDDGNWYSAMPLVNRESGSKTASGYGFLQGAKIGDANTVRMLNEGHYAFTAKGYDGSEVYVPYGQGYAPAKEGRGRVESGDSKREVAQGAPQRDMVTATTAKPGNVIGGQKTLLGDAMGNQQKTLLGGNR